VTGGAVDGDEVAEDTVASALAMDGGAAARGLLGLGGRNVALISPIPKKSSAHQRHRSVLVYKRKPKHTWHHLDKIWDISPDI